MKHRPHIGESIPPPSFKEAKNRRQKVRSSGLDPNHWYVVSYAGGMKPGTVKEIVFWKRSIALFRTKSGNYHALENRCAHRQIKLSHGVVEGCHLVCQYHGWKYNEKGEVVSIEHDTFGRKNLKFRISSYPVQEKYGLVWLFPGDPKKAEEKPLPQIPELELESEWTSTTFEYKWRTHHSMILENVSDYTHEYLHRKTKPFRGAKLVKCETASDGDRIDVAYEAKIAVNPIMNLFIDRSKVDSGLMKLTYTYPYNFSNTDEYIKHFISIIPIDENHTHFFFTFIFRPFKIPFTPFKMPHFAMKAMARLSRPMISTVMAEDKIAVEWEMDGYEEHWGAPLAELSPMVKAFQDLTIRKWEEYLATVEEKRSGARRKASGGVS